MDQPIIKASRSHEVSKQLRSRILSLLTASLVFATLAWFSAGLFNLAFITVLAWLCAAMFGALSLLNVAIYLATRFPLMVYADRIIGPGGALVSTIKRDTITSLAIHPRHDMPCFVTRDPKSGAEQYLSIQWHWFQDEPEALLKRLEKEFGPLQTGVEMKTPDA